MTEEDKDKIKDTNDQNSDESQKNQLEDENKKPESKDELQSGSESYISVDQSHPI